MTYAMFWGCQIPARLPFVEKSVRLVLDQLGTPYQDLEGFTCCPERELIRTANEDLWLVAGTRNLALAEQEGLDVLTPCNGCYSTQKEIIHQLKKDHQLKAEVNQVERNFGLEYKGDVKVKHLVEFLHDEVGLTQLRKQAETSFSGMRMAVHNGCHLLRPNPAITFDDPMNPIKFDAVVGALGGRSVPHSTKMLCCGQGFNSVEEPDKSASLVADKIRELSAMGVKCLVTACPMCFIQYDLKQTVMRRQGEDVHVPVFYISELIALTMGYSPEEIGLDLHRTDTAPFFAEWKAAREGLDKAREHFDLTVVEKCFQCGGCMQDCPSVKTDPSWNPQEIMGKIVAGQIDELLESRDIWQCIDCFVCDELCPQRFSWRMAFETLRHLALERELVPRGARNAFDAFRKSGRLIEATVTTQGQRAKLGLPSGSSPDLGILTRLLGTVQDHEHEEPHEEPSFIPPEEEEEPSSAK